MAIKVKKTIANKTQTTSRIDLFDGVKLPVKVKRRVAREVGELLVDETLLAVGNSKSPLSGQTFPGLSKEYKKFKLSKNRPGKPNLEFKGDMLDAFKSKVTSNGLLDMGVFGKQAPKADGHNNLSSKSSLPLRRFLPDESDSYKGAIVSQIDSIVNEAVAESVTVPRQKLAVVETKAQFFSVLRESLNIVQQVKIIDVILGNEKLLNMVTELGLTRFLR